MVRNLAGKSMSGCTVPEYAGVLQWAVSCNYEGMYFHSKLVHLSMQGEMRGWLAG